MMLPNAERVVVDIRKLRDYCLDPLHDAGQHKVRLFATTLGMTADDAEALRALLLEAVTTHEAHLGRRDTYGQRYTVDCQVVWQDQRATIRSGWIIEHAQAQKSSGIFPGHGPTAVCPVVSVTSLGGLSALETSRHYRAGGGYEPILAADAACYTGALNLRPDTMADAQPHHPTPCAERLPPWKPG